MKEHCILALALAWLACTVPLMANDNVGPPWAKPDAGGWVHEAAKFPASFKTFPTDRNGKRIDPPPAGWPTEAQEGVRGSDGIYRTKFKIPATPGAGVFDAVNETTPIMPPGKKPPGAGGGGAGGGHPRAVLNLEAWGTDRDTGEYVIEGLFDRLAEDAAVYGSWRVPDLYADTNGNEEWDDDDLLYSVVDMYSWIRNPVAFEFEDVYTVVDGKVAELPNMMFSTTPFTFSPTTGWSGGTPFNGQAVVFTDHTPEPATAALLALGGMWFLYRRRT